MTRPLPPRPGRYTIVETHEMAHTASHPRGAQRPEGGGGRGAGAKGRGAMGDADARGAGLRVDVKVGARSVALELGAGATLVDLQAAVEAQAGGFKREQRLIFKGRVLQGPPGSLLGRDLGLGPGRAKVMCLRAGGPTPVRPAPTARGPRRSDKAKSTPAAAARRPTRAAPGEAAARGAAAGRTGVIACPGQGLKVVPGWAAAGAASPEAVRVVDFSGNDLIDLAGEGGRAQGGEAGVSEGREAAAVCGSVRSDGRGGSNATEVVLPWNRMVGLQRLVATGNARLSFGGIPWSGLMYLPGLRMLDFSGCALEKLPENFGGGGSFPALETLSLQGNRLTELPGTIGGLKRLKVLDLGRNLLEALPPGLGVCATLEELDVACNRIRDLPPELGALKKLKALRADGNWVRAVPTEVLRGCEELATLGLHGNPISLQELQALEGFDAFEERRRKKYDKKVDMSVMGSEGFDQGADSEAHRCPRR